MTMPKTAMWIGRGVDVLEVGHLRTRIELSTRELDRQRMFVPNYALEPQPCWCCKGTGRVLRWSCPACTGRGHSPNMTPAVAHLSKAARTAYIKGYQDGVGEQQLIITAHYEEMRELEAPESYHLCGECLCNPCECTDEE